MLLLQGSIYESGVLIKHLSLCISDMSCTGGAGEVILVYVCLAAVVSLCVQS